MQYEMAVTTVFSRGLLMKWKVKEEFVMKDGIIL